MTALERMPARKVYFWIDPLLPPAEYDAKWIAGIKARCEIDAQTGCWLWTRFCHTFRNIKPHQRGYAGGSYRGKNVRIHRKMLELKLGREMLPKMQSCHECDTTHCVNPDHLYEATNAKNHQDGGKRGRMQGQWKTHCKHNHEFTPENTYLQVRGGITRRICRECGRLRCRQAWANGKAKIRQQRLRAKYKE